MTLIDLFVFLIFTGAIVLFGCSFSIKKTNARDFTSAGHSVPGWVVGMSIFSTYVSSISYLGNPGTSFAGNWNAFVFGLSIPIAAFFASRYFVPFYRSNKSISAYAFLEERFGVWARLYASTCYLLTQVARMGSILFLLAMPMHVLMGWDLRAVIFCTTAAITLYTILGGMRAVIWTEAVQGFILIGGAVVCLILLLHAMPQGPQQTFDIAFNTLDADGRSKFSLGSFSLTDFSQSTFWVCLIYGVFINLQNYGIDQNYVQRYHTALNVHEARTAVLFGGYLFIPVSAVFFFIGTALFAYYQVYPCEEVNALVATGKTDFVFPYYIVHALPVGLTGLLFASIFAAGMSTVATSITSCATVLYADFYPHFPHRKQESHAAEDSRHLVFLKTASLSMGIIACVVALALIGVKSILDAWWKLSSIFSGGMLGLFLLGYITRRVSSRAALIGVVCGIALIAYLSAWQLLHLPNPHLHEYLAIVIGTTAIFLVGFLASLLLPLARKKTVS